MSWSPLDWSWISTRWSRGFKICGLVALARSDTPGTLRICS
jgi:hypothetical protein